MGFAAAAMMAFQVISSIASYQQSNAQADAQQNMARQQADANSKAAWDNYNSQKSQLEVQANEITAQSSNEMSERAKSAAIEQARIRNAAAESGVAGLSVNSLIQDSAFQQGMDDSGIVTNMNSRLRQNNNQLNGARAKAASDSNQGSNSANNTISNAQGHRQSLLSTGLQIAGSVGSYAQGQGAGKPKTVGGS